MYWFQTTLYTWVLIPKPAQILEAVGGYSEDSREDGSNGAVPGSDVQDIDVVCVTLCKRELGGDLGDAQGPDRVPPSGGATYHGDDGETWGRRRVVVSRGRGGDGLCRDPPHMSMHKEAADDHIV